jgi:hypothetical protein
MTDADFKILEGECDNIVNELEVRHDEKLNKLRDDVKRVMEYDKSEGSNMELEIIKCHSALARFSDALARERHVYNVYKNKYDRFYAQEVDNAKMNPKMFRTTSELDGAVIRSSKIARAKTFIDSYSEYLEFLEKSIDNVKNKSYGIRNILDYRKIERGM